MIKLILRISFVLIVLFYTSNCFGKQERVTSNPHYLYPWVVSNHLLDAKKACEDFPEGVPGREDCIRTCEDFAKEIDKAYDNDEVGKKYWKACKEKQDFVFGVTEADDPGVHVGDTILKMKDFAWVKINEQKYWYAGQITDFKDKKVQVTFRNKKSQWFTHDKFKPIKIPELVEVNKGHNGNYYQAEVTFLGILFDANVNYTDRLPWGTNEFDTRDCTVRNSQNLEIYQDNVSIFSLRTYDNIESDRKNSLSSFDNPCNREKMFVSNCPAVPVDLQNKEYGEAIHRTDTACFTRYLTKPEQFFLGGLTSAMMQNCNFSIFEKENNQLIPFLESIWIVANLGGPVYGSNDLSESLIESSVSMAALYAGLRTAEKLGCFRESKAILNGLNQYLSWTSSKKTGGRQFADTCSHHYYGKYSQEQCQCVANLSRVVLPDIHSREFDPEIIRDIIRRNPFLGGPIIGQCGISNY